jgi:hypothetical protein
MRQLRRRANQGAILVKHKRVAAFHHSQRGQGSQACVQCLKASRPSPQGSLQRSFQSRRPDTKFFPHSRQHLPRFMMKHVCDKLSHVALASPHQSVHACFHAKACIIQPLTELADHRSRPPFRSIQRDVIEPLPCMQKLKSRCTLKAIRLERNSFSDAMLRFSNDFCSG